MAAAAALAALDEGAAARIAAAAAVMLSAAQRKAALDEGPGNVYDHSRRNSINHLPYWFRKLIRHKG